MTSIALDSLDRPSIAYVRYDYQSDELRYAAWDGAAWQISVVDDTRWALYPSLALTSGDSPRISYEDADRSDLMYAWYDTTGWHRQYIHQTANQIGQWSSLALDSGDLPRVSYSDESGRDIRYAWFDGTVWQNEKVADMGFASALALDSTGAPHIILYDAGNGGSGKLYHSWKDGTGWHQELVDPDVGLYAGSVDAEYDSQGNLCTGYQRYNEAGSDARYATNEGGSWAIETADGDNSVGRFTQLALDSTDQPHLLYYDDTTDTTIYAWRDSTGWHRQDLGVNGSWTSLALDSHDHAHIAYWDEATDSLIYGTDIPEPAACLLFGGGLAILWARGSRPRRPRP